MTQEDQHEVVIIRYGTRRTTRSEVFLNNHLYAEPDGPIEMDYFFWVVRGPNSTIVVDTGFSRAGGEARRRTFLLDPADALAQLGVDTASERTIVVVTHAHYDHIGNLTLFPHSPVVISERELEFWSGPHRDRTLFHHSVDDEGLTHLAAIHAEGRTRPFSGRVEVVPGVEVIEVGGHTPGQSMVLVQTAEGPVLLASDAVHYYEELDGDRPFSSVADIPAMFDAFDAIRGMVADDTVRHVVSGHDPATLERFTALPGDGLAGHAARIGTPIHAGAVAS